MYSNDRQNQTETASLYGKPFPSYHHSRRRCQRHSENIMSQSKSFAFRLLWLFAALGPLLFYAQSPPVQVSSPDHQIALCFKVQPGTNKQAAATDGQLVYAVTFHQKKIFEDSAIRLELAGQLPLGAAVQITGANVGSGVDDYSL